MTSGGRETPFFFLAYARTPEKPWVKKLFHELSHEVYERTTFPDSAAVGFMDVTGIPPGHDWREEIYWALATCRVFVPLYSPRYFTSVECGREWHAFAQRTLDHQARSPLTQSAIVPALWAPIVPSELPEVAQRIQMDHADLGDEYASEGFYTLIKNKVYQQQYVTAVQRLAQHIIRAAEASRLQSCRISDLNRPGNAFVPPQRNAPGDQRLNVIVAAPTLDRMPDGRDPSFYGTVPDDWNPFHPQTQQPIGEYAAGVARLNFYRPTLLTLEEGCDLLSAQNPAEGLGLLLVDAWAGEDAEMARRLAALDALRTEWVGTMVIWNMSDSQTQLNADRLASRLQKLLPNRLGDNRPMTPVNSARIRSPEELRTKFPGVVEHALRRYLDYAEAWPPSGDIPPRPRLLGTMSFGSDVNPEGGST